MIGIEPAVVTAAEIAGQPVRVSLETEAAEEKFLFVGAAIAIGVPEMVNVGDAERDDAVSVGIEADGDVQPFGESGDFPGAAVRADLRENFDRVAGRPVGWGRK